MDLPLELRPSRPDLSAPTPTYVVLSAPEGTPFAAAAPLLARAAGLNQEVRWACAGASVPPEATLGAPPLLEGALLEWARPHEGQECPPPPRPAPTCLSVVAGPDAGRRWLLPPGRYVLGRGQSADLILKDPDASRRHGLLSLDPDGAHLIDLGSTNRTLLDGSPLAAVGERVRAGQVVSVGATRLTLRAAPDAAGTHAAVRPRGDGTLALNRVPRVRTAPQAPTVRLPSAPAPAEHPRFSVLTLVLPLVVSAVAALLLHSPVFLAFGLLGPAMSLAQFLGERRHHSRRATEDGVRHERALREAHAHIVMLAAREAGERRRDCPDLARAAEACLERTGALWRRSGSDEDFLLLSVGRGRQRATFRVRDAHGEESFPELPDVPLPVPLGAIGVVGVAGPGGRGLVRGLLLQLLAWHSPQELRLWVLAPEERPESWGWLAWAPHARSGDGPSTSQVATDPAATEEALAQLGAILAARAEDDDAGGRATLPRHVVVLPSSALLREDGAVARLLRDGPDLGVNTICLADALDDLPVEACALVELSGREGLWHTGEGVQPFAPDRCPLDVAQAAARALAPLRDAAPGAELDLPARVRLCDVWDGDPFCADAVSARWATRPADTCVPLGLGAGGPVEIDLVRDGPHALIAGTTGAGKSELLRSLITALALRNAPDRMAFVLIDYKGGSAFDACAGLPHVVGLVTDLDADATRRALAGLEAELRSREAALRAAGAADLSAYTQLVAAGGRADDGSPLRHLARLVIVVDEFRVLAEELPDFVNGLVRLAALGRSLGLHLVLATQRPAGIVSADMRANLALRVCLRVRDAHDALDVVDCADPARISPQRPGRAILRASSAPAEVVQTTYLGDGAATDAPVEVRLVTPGTVGHPLPALPLLARGDAGTSTGPARGAAGLDDLARAGAAMREAATRAGLRPPAPPWLPPLPEALDWQELVATAEPASLQAGPAADPPAPSRGCHGPVPPTLLVDDPVGQRRFAEAWSPRRGSLAVVGGPRSGRTATLRSLLLATLEGSCPRDLAVYIVDAGGRLADVGTAPHVGAYLRLDEVGALRRLIAALQAEAVSGPVAAARAGSGAAEDDTPHRLLVIDGWEQLRATLEGVDHGTGLDALAQALRGGALTVLAAGERGLLTGPLAPLLPQRLVLDIADPTDAYLAGIDPTQGRRPPGRALRSWDGLSAQVALAPAPYAPPQGSAHAGCPGPRLRVRSLPMRVDLAELRPEGAGTAPYDVVVGLRSDDRPCTLTLDGRAVLIAGPRGSGRTTALWALAAGLSAQGREYVWCPGHARPHEEGAAAALAAHLLARPATIVLADDVEGLTGTEWERVLQEHAERRGAGSVVAAGCLNDLVAGYRGLVGTLRRSGYGLLISPGPRAAELYGVPLPQGEPAAPGRALLVRDADVLALQIAYVRPEDQTPTMPITAMTATRTPSPA